MQDQTSALTGINPYQTMSMREGYGLNPISLPDQTGVMGMQQNYAARPEFYTANTQVLPTLLPQQNTQQPQQSQIGYGYNIGGGGGLSGIGAGVGALVSGGNPAGALAGSAIGSALDIGIDLIASAQQRREERKLYRQQELQNHKNRLREQKTSFENMKMNKESHALNMESRQLDLESAKMSLAEQKNAKMVQLVKSYFGNNARRLDPLTRSLT